MTLWGLGLVAALLYGVAIGSFLNVVIWRLPQGQSVAEPVWSYCPRCKHRLSTADLVPLLSFLALGRKCRYCRAPISWRYFGVEALTGLLFFLVYLRYGWSADTVFYALLVALLTATFFIDLDSFIIPDELSVLAFVLGVAHNLYAILRHLPGQWTRLGGGHVPNSIVGAVLMGLAFHVISLIGYLYYTGRAPQLGKRLAGFVWGIIDDYIYLAAKFSYLGRWVPSVQRYVAAHEVLDEGEADKTREEIARELEESDEQTGMGQGDAKLMAAIGANLYLPLSLVAFFLSVVAGGLVGIGLRLRGSDGRTAIPFGPYIVLGAVVSLLAGDRIIGWYMAYMHLAAAGR